MFNIIETTLIVVAVSACYGQVCGVYDTLAAAQSVAVFNNSAFSVSAGTCDDVFMKSRFPPMTSQLVQLEFSPNQVSSFLKILDNLKDFDSCNREY
jgi:hypothetical protein